MIRVVNFLVFTRKVFTPFYRLERSRSRDTGGVGLGLAVAQAVIREHGGNITLSNRPEGGLRQTVVLLRNQVRIA
jgi:signal transduction histidine kinase